VGRSLLQTTETVSNTLRIAASPSDSASQDGLVGYDVRLTRERSPVRTWVLITSLEHAV